MAVFLEERVDARNASVPTVLQILERQTSILRESLLPLERVLGPHSQRVDELALPRHDVPATIIVEQNSIQELRYTSSYLYKLGMS